LYTAVGYAHFLSGEAKRFTVKKRHTPLRYRPSIREKELLTLIWDEKLKKAAPRKQMKRNLKRRPFPNLNSNSGDSLWDLGRIGTISKVGILGNDSTSGSRLWQTKPLNLSRPKKRKKN